MNYYRYSQPETCVPGEQYYLLIKKPDLSTVFRKVKFIGYRPHPAEVLVEDRNIKKVIHRVNLFQKNGKGKEQAKSGRISWDQYDFSSSSESGLGDRLGA